MQDNSEKKRLIIIGIVAILIIGPLLLWYISAQDKKKPIQQLIKSKNAASYYNKGIASIKNGNYKEAIEAFNKALKLQPKFAEAYNNKGTALRNLKRYKEALCAYKNYKKYWRGDLAYLQEVEKIIKQLEETIKSSLD